MTVTPIRRTSPKPADRQFQAAMARNLARIVAGYATSGATPEVARELEVHAEETRLDRLAEAARDAYDEREEAAGAALIAALEKELDR